MFFFSLNTLTVICSLSLLYVQLYLQSIVFTIERHREDGDIEDNAKAVKDREGQDEMEEGPLEVKGKGEDDVECYHVS